MSEKILIANYDADIVNDEEPHQSPNAVSDYFMESNKTGLVRMCKNCSYSFRTEFNPNSEFCSKGNNPFTIVILNFISLSFNIMK